MCVFVYCFHVCHRDSAGRLVSVCGSLHVWVDPHAYTWLSMTEDLLITMRDYHSWCWVTCDTHSHSITSAKNGGGISSFKMPEGLGLSTHSHAGQSPWQRVSLRA